MPRAERFHFLLTPAFRPVTLVSMAISRFNGLRMGLFGMPESR